MSQFNRSQVNLIKQADLLNLEFPVVMNPSDLHAPHIYDIMMKFAADDLPKPPLVTRNSQTKKLNVQYVKRKPVPAVVNTRNPFSRLFAAWSDKFNYRSSFLKQKKPNERLKWIYETRDNLRLS